MNDKAVLEWTRRGLGLAAALAVLAACADEPTMPRGAEQEMRGDAPALATHLTCTVEVEAGSMACDPSSPSGTNGGPNMNLIVGSQHRLARLTADSIETVAGHWLGYVKVQNLTLQPMGTLDGEAPTGNGVRVFFVDEPNNGVRIVNEKDSTAFTGSDPQPYYQYTGAALGADGILSPGETSGLGAWLFELNGATEFRFSVLVWTEVPDPAAYAVRFRRIDGGGVHSCADGDDGKVYCWGQNDHGQLGDGTTVSRNVPAPVAAPGGISLHGVAVGHAFTCALSSDGKAYCWGRNTSWQLGDGTNTDRLTPVPVNHEGPALRSVAVGNNHACAEGVDDKVYCWGNNGFGKLGNGTNLTPHGTVVAAAPENVGLSRVAVGTNHSCADGSDGRVYCWGNNARGHLGEGTDSTRLVPTPVIAPEDVTLSRPRLGHEFTCALGSDGSAYCWGRNEWGQLGDGTTTDRPVPTPVATSAAAPFTALDLASNTACALDAHGNAWCWGNNGSGTLGTGDLLSSSVPGAVKAPAGVTFEQIGLGGNSACAMSTGGDAWCWGRNDTGQLGDGTTVSRWAPVLVAGTRGR